MKHRVNEGAIAAFSALNLLSVNALADISIDKSMPVEARAWYAWQHARVNDSLAYTLGARGKGVVVDVIDTGIASKNREFSGRLLAGFNALNNSSNAEDDNGHGTHTAGLIGAAANGIGVVGEAPEVQIRAIKALDKRGYGTQAQIESALAYAARDNARIINMSIGGRSPIAQSQLQAAIHAGKLLVVAAGNDAALAPGYPAIYAKESWANNQIVVVGSIGAKGQLSSFSNKAGSAMYNYLVAPGESIVSSYLNNATASASGTSQAAPIVSGIAADIISRWMYLKPNQVASILFTTATRMGKATASTPDPVYGWGLVNAAAALAPVGNPKVASFNASYYNLGPAALQGNAVVSGTRFAGIKITATDDFGRDFQYDAGQFVNTHTPDPLLAPLRMMDAQMNTYRQTVGNSTVRYSTIDGHTAASLSGQAGASNYSFGTGRQSIDQYLGLAELAFEIPLTTTLGNPYLNYAGENAAYAGIGYAATPVGFKFAMMDGRALNADLAGTSVQPRGSAMVIEISARTGSYFASAALGSMQEQSAMLGASTASFLNAAGATTRFVTLNTGYRVSSRSAVVGMLSQGYTRTSGADSLLTDVNMVSRGMAMAYVQSGWLTTDDVLAVGISQPMRIVAGGMNLRLPHMQDSGSLLFGSDNVSLVSDSPETMFEVGYQARSLGGAKLMLNAAYRVNANNSPGNMAVVACRYLKPF